MIKFLNSITLNKPGRLRSTFLFELAQSFLKGQPFFVILLVVLELLKPLQGTGEEVSQGNLLLYTLWMGLSLILLFFCTKYGAMTQTRVAYGIGTEGRIRLGDYLRKLSMGFFKGRDPGDITALMLQDYSNIEVMLSHLLMNAIGAVVLPVVFLFFLTPVNWGMALITLLPVPLSALAAVATRWIVMRTGQKQMRSKNNATSRMLEYLDGIKNIKAYNLTGAKFSRLERSFRDLKRDSIRLEGAGGPAVMLGIWILNMGIPLIMLSGFHFVMAGSLSVAHFLFFLIIGTRMYDPLSKILVNFIELSYYSISVKRINAIYDVKPLPGPVDSAPLLRHDIEFRNVTFRYHNTDVLRDVSFAIPHNKMTALIGPSGSGKSTITRLIARFWDVNTGEVMIGGQSVREISATELMKNISVVFQDVYLFHDSVYNNIKLGKKDATEEEVRAAAKKARCHDFIKNMEAGYDTVVGEGGATLSGGEKQRISIARAILKDAPIVLLDEATASLDPENELYIQEAIDELIKGRTLIVIAHRLSTVTHADRILVLDGGKILESGTHEQLLQRRQGVYRRMWMEQEKAHTWRIAG